MRGETHYAFLDESGTAGFLNGTRFLVAAGLIAANARDLELPIRRILKKHGRSLTSGEMKAARASEQINQRLLGAIASRDISIVAVMIDQHAIRLPPTDPEEIYRQAVARAIHHMVERYPRIEICLDKRYTNETLAYLLEKHIRANLVDLPAQMVLLRQQSSQARKELQAVDAVAWAFFQKYERGDPRFYELIAARVIVEDVVSQKKWIV